LPAGWLSPFRRKTLEYVSQYFPHYFLYSSWMGFESAAVLEFFKDAMFWEILRFFFQVQKVLIVK
jgi:hypothetical protein